MRAKHIGNVSQERTKTVLIQFLHQNDNKEHKVSWCFEGSGVDVEGDCKEACVLLAEVGSHRREYRGGCREPLKNQQCMECLSICNRVFVNWILSGMWLCKVSRPAAKMWISMHTKTILANAITAVVEGRRRQLLTASEISPHCAIACRMILYWLGMSSRWRTVLVIVNKMFKMRECYKTHSVKKIYKKNRKHHMAKCNAGLSQLWFRQDSCYRPRPFFTSGTLR